MNDMFDIAQFESIAGIDIETENFHEFCENLRELDSLFEESAFDLFEEEVQDPKTKVGSKLGLAARRTWSSTKDMASAYGNITDAGGDVYKSIFDLIWGGITLAIRVLSFILRQISLIPKAILAVANKIVGIPEDVKNKIQGNIKLYFTAADIEKCYNQLIISQLDQFISMANALSSGETWSTFFRRRSDTWVKGTNGVDYKVDYVPDNDIKMCKKMRAAYVRFNVLEIEQTVVEMNKMNVAIYFGDSKVVSFTDLKGKHHEDTYYGALTQLMADLHHSQQSLQNVNKVLGQKYDSTLMNQQFTQLNNAQKNLIKDSVMMVSKSISIVGNIMKCVMTDMKTIDTEVNKLVKKKKLPATAKNT